MAHRVLKEGMKANDASGELVVHHSGDVVNLDSYSLPRGRLGALERGGYVEVTDARVTGPTGEGREKIAVVAEVAPEPIAEPLECCGKEFQSEHGLKVHRGRTHKE